MRQNEPFRVVPLTTYSQKIDIVLVKYLELNNFLVKLQATGIQLY